MRSLIHIVFLLLSGRRGVLGIEIHDTGLRIVELRISFFVRFLLRPRVEVLKYASYNASLEELQAKGDDARNHLLSNVRSRWALLVLNTSQVRTGTSLVPLPEADSIPQWIAANHERIHGLPVQLSQLLFIHQVRSAEQNGISVDVSFVRKDYLDRTKQLFRFLGLTPLGIWLGLMAETERPADLDLFSRSALKEEYSNAFHAALRGLVPANLAAPLLTEQEKDALDSRAHRTVFQRVVLGLGGVLFALLAIPMLLSLHFESRLLDAQDQLVALGPAYSEVRSLQEQVEELENQLGGPSAAIRRSQMSESLARIAESTGPSVWFTQFTINESDTRRFSVSITGYARTTSDITKFMKSLKSKKVADHVSLVRTGTPGHEFRPVELRPPDSRFVEYQLQAVLAP